MPGIAQIGEDRGAWLKDSEDNLPGTLQRRYRLAM